MQPPCVAQRCRDPGFDGPPREDTAAVRWGCVVVLPGVGTYRPLFPVVGFTWWSISPAALVSDKI